MAVLLVQRICQKKGMFQTTILAATELLLLSTGFFYIFHKLKQAIHHYRLLQIFLSILGHLWMSYRALFLSPLRIIFINSIIIVLILVSSRRFQYLPKLELAYDAFVKNLRDSVFNMTATERWEEEKTVSYDGDPPPPRIVEESKEMESSATNTATTNDISDTIKATSTFLENLGFDKELFLENEDVEDDGDGEATLKDIQVACFRTLSGTLRVASGIFYDDEPHSMLELVSQENHQSPEEDLEYSSTGNESRSNEDLIFSEDNEIVVEEVTEEDTMEATWYAITGGGGRGGGDKEKNIKLKKSDTWRPPAKISEEWLEATWKDLRKTVTFNDAVSASRRGGLARDHTINSDELNKRCDDFIKNVNNQWRLQRQESKQRELRSVTVN